MFPLTDTHCHLDFNVFDPDREAVLTRAWEAGLVRLLVPGIDLASSVRAVHLADEYPQVYAGVGVHPNSALSWGPDTAHQLRNLAASPRVVAIGEIGLDYYRQGAPRAVQQDVLRAQLDLAAECSRPVIIHNRQATEDLLAILSEWQARMLAEGSPLAECPGVLHSFGGPDEVAEQAIRLGFFLGISGPVTFRNARDLQGMVARLPLERLLLETDAPFLTPHPRRGRRNEPAYVRFVAEKLSDLREEPLAQVASQTTANAARLFGWGEAS